MPVIGFLNGGSSDGYVAQVAAFRQGLKEGGYVEGQNVKIEYRWADDRYDRLPEMATDLVRHEVTAIIANTPAVRAAQAATKTIPIVFITGADPVAFGLVASLNRPGGNLTGVASLVDEVGPKRLELLHELLPSATIVALLINPTNPRAAVQARETQAAGRALGQEIHVLNARTESAQHSRHSGNCEPQPLSSSTTHYSTAGWINLPLQRPATLYPLSRLGVSSYSPAV
jgi:putative ABC transport system substrate-binding protein